MRDYCKGCRSTYNAILGLLSQNNVLATIIAGLPNYILIGLCASQWSYFAYSIYSSATYTILAFLLLAWIISIISIFKVYPNLLTVSIFVYKCLAHWSIVSLLIMIFYGWKYVPMQIVGSLLGTLFPLIISLFLCGDVLVSVRRRLFTIIETAQAHATHVETAFSLGEAKESPV